jgi:hypothetical protein
MTSTGRELLSARRTHPKRALAERRSRRGLRDVIVLPQEEDLVPDPEGGGQFAEPAR